MSRIFKDLMLSGLVLISMLGIGSSASANSNHPLTKYTKVVPINSHRRATRVRVKPITTRQRRQVLKHIHKKGNYYYVSEANRMSFQSQFFTQACEVALIKNVLSIHNKANNVSLIKICEDIGWSKSGRGNWNKEYTHNPFYSHYATISPSLKVKILRHYGVHAHVHNYLSKQLIIRDLKRGNQLIAEAGDDCNVYKSNKRNKQTDHILAIIGIKQNKKGLFVQYVDSKHEIEGDGVQWTPFNKFWASYNRPKVTGDRLVVAGY